MNLEDVTLSDVSQSQTDEYRGMPLRRVIRTVKLRGRRWGEGPRVQGITGQEKSRDGWMDDGCTEERMQLMRQDRALRNA